MTAPTYTPRHVAVIGAGLAGLTAALTLLQRGHQVTLFEAAPQAGGRARSVSAGKTVIDNGQHLCIGAYQATLSLITTAGLQLDDVFLRLPLALHMHDQSQARLQRFSLVTPHWLPAPLHLLWGLLLARGFSLTSKWRAIGWMRHLKRQQFQLTQDQTVSTLLQQARQTPQAIRWLWEPLCLAALNTPLQQASAQVFLNVLRDSFQRQRTDSDLLIFKTDLSNALIKPLLQRVDAAGGRLHLRTAVEGITDHHTHCTISTSDGEQTVDAVVLAVGPHQLKTVNILLPPLPALRYQPITTIYLQYAADTRLPYPMMGLCFGWAQWVFDRGQCCGQPGLLAVVISAHAPLPADKHTLINQCIADLNTILAPYGITLGTTPDWTRIITEKRATFSCDAHVQRPATHTSQPNIFLAGDYVQGDYPATIEGAVRSGLAAADQLASAAT